MFMCPRCRFHCAIGSGKRLLGGANMLLRRRRLFAKARPKLAALARFADREHIDVALCTGDYTGLGTMPELEQARPRSRR